MQALNNWSPIAVIVGGYLLGIYFQNRSIDKLENSLGKRIDDLSAKTDKRFDDLYKYLDLRFSGIEKRLEKLENQPLVKR